MKKLNPIKSLLLYVLVGLCSTACNNDEVDIPNPEQPDQTACQLTKIKEEGDAGYRGIVYNTQGYAMKVQYRQDVYDLLTYDADNQLVKAEYYSNGQIEYLITYEYTNGLLTSTTDYGPGMVRHSIISLKYDDNKRLIETSDGGSNGGFRATYTYDSKGNVIREEWFNSNVLTYAATYESYDDKHTYHSAIKGFPSFIFNGLSKNNPGKVTRSNDKNRDGIIQPDETRVTTHTYKYNSDGFPTEVTKTNSDGADVTTFTYTCK